MNTEMMLIRILEEVMEMDEGSLSGSSDFQSLEEWDSLASISLMAELEDVLNVTVDPEALKACGTVALLTELVDKSKA